MLQKILYLCYAFINWITEVNQYFLKFYFIALENKCVPRCIRVNILCIEEKGAIETI